MVSLQYYYNLDNLENFSPLISPRKVPGFKARRKGITQNVIFILEL